MILFFGLVIEIGLPAEILCLEFLDYNEIKEYFRWATGQSQFFNGSVLGMNEAYGELRLPHAEFSFLKDHCPRTFLTSET